MGKRIIQVAAGWAHSVAVSWAGDAYTWGWGLDGMLGHGDEVSRFLPTRVTLTNEAITQRERYEAHASSPLSGAKVSTEVETSLYSAETVSRAYKTDGPPNDLELMSYGTKSDRKYRPGHADPDAEGSRCGSSAASEIPCRRGNTHVTCAAAGKLGTILGTRSGRVLVAADSLRSYRCERGVLLGGFHEYWHLLPEGVTNKSSEENSRGKSRGCWRVGDLRLGYGTVIGTVIDSSGQAYALVGGNPNPMPLFSLAGVALDRAAGAYRKGKHIDARSPSNDSANGAGSNHDLLADYSTKCMGKCCAKDHLDIPQDMHSQVCGTSASGDGRRDGSEDLGSTGGPETTSAWTVGGRNMEANVDSTMPPPARRQKRTCDRKAALPFEIAEGEPGAREAGPLSVPPALVLSGPGIPTSFLAPAQPKLEHPLDPPHGPLAFVECSTVFYSPAAEGSHAEGPRTVDDEDGQRESWSVFGADGVQGCGNHQALIAVTKERSILCALPTFDARPSTRQSSQPQGESAGVGEQARETGGPRVNDSGITFRSSRRGRYGNGGGVVCADVYMDRSTAADSDHGVMLLDGGRSLLTWGGAQAGKVCG